MLAVACSSRSTLVPMPPAAPCTVGCQGVEGGPVHGVAVASAVAAAHRKYAPVWWQFDSGWGSHRRVNSWQFDSGWGSHRQVNGWQFDSGVGSHRRVNGWQFDSGRGSHRRVKGWQFDSGWGSHRRVNGWQFDRGWGSHRRVASPSLRCPKTLWGMTPLSHCQHPASTLHRACLALPVASRRLLQELRVLLLCSRTSNKAARLQLLTGG